MSDAHSTSHPILEVRNLRVQFQVRGEGQWPWSPKRFLKAVDGVSFGSPVVIYLFLAFWMEIRKNIRRAQNPTVWEF